MMRYRTEGTFKRGDVILVRATVLRDQDPSRSNEALVELYDYSSDENIIITMITPSDTHHVDIDERVASTEDDDL